MKLFAQVVHAKMAARASIMTRCIYASVQADIMVIIAKQVIMHAKKLDQIVGE